MLALVHTARTDLVNAFGCSFSTRPELCDELLAPFTVRLEVCAELLDPGVAAELQTPHPYLHC